MEKEKYNGPLKEYILNASHYRNNASYNKEYKYIKEIIWDNEAQEKFGNTRDGYEKFRNDESYPGGISYSGEIDLRIRTDVETGDVLGYLTESKKTMNDDFEHMIKQFEDAKAKTFEILGVKDVETFNFWLEEYAGGIFGFSRSGANETIIAIETLESIIIEYDKSKKFKKFIDKIKG